MVTSEKQNAELLADIVKDCREAAKIRRQQNFHPLSARDVAGIYERLADSIERATAPSPHPRGEPVAADIDAAYEKHAKRIFGTGPKSIDSITHFYAGFKAGALTTPPPTETAEQWSARWQKAKEEMANLPAGADAVRESIYACAESTLIGFREELTEQQRKFICDQISRKATLPPPQPQEKPTGDQT